MDALIGHTGFVGSNLLTQHPAFTHRFRSVDIHTLPEHTYDRIVCAGAPGAKWLANRDPDADRAAITRLIQAIERVECRRFILISTVDVFGAPVDVDEGDFPVPGDAYGAHRLALEHAVQARFPDALVVRLPGLVGPGLRKNALFDLHNQHALDRLDSRGVYQYYPVPRLWEDLTRAEGAHVLHLVSAPLNLGEIARSTFGVTLAEGSGPAPRYDVRSRHAGLWRAERWQVSADESRAAIAAWARTEPRR